MILLAQNRDPKAELHCTGKQGIHIKQFNTQIDNILGRNMANNKGQGQIQDMRA